MFSSILSQSGHVFSFVRNFLCYYLCLWLIFSPSFPAFAGQPGITVDSGAHQGKGSPALGQSNGVDVLNIAKPSAGGVSHNKFTEFNVNEQGLIINNLDLQHYSTQHKSAISGGHVEFNPNLGTGAPARVIINEVTGNSTTSLKGYTEIYGHKADYVLANPNGITASGAGFINVSRLTLITGTPNVENGHLKDFNISPVGILKIEGVGEQNFGLHVNGSYADLVSNVVKIAGNIHADGDLNVLTGNDKYDYASRTVSSNNTAPVVEVAVDSTALGGMRAGNIKIYATQKAMGVNVPGNLVADAGELEITADGDIVFKTAVAQKNIRVTSKKAGVKNTDGQVLAGGAIKASAKTDVKLSGQAVQGKAVEITAGRDVQSKALVAAEESLKVTAGRDLLAEKTADNPERSGAFHATDQLEIKAGNDLRLAGAYAQGRAVTTEAGRDFINQSQLVSETSLTATAGRDLVSKNLSGATDSGGFYAVNSLALGANSDVSLAGSHTYARNLRIISGKDFVNNTRLASDGSLSILAVQDLVNNASIDVAGEFSLTAGRDLLNNSNIWSGRLIRLQAGGDIRNTAKIASLGAAYYSGQNLYNYGQLSAGQNMYFDLERDFINYRDSGVLAGGGIDFGIGRNLINYQAEIFALGDISFNGKPGALGRLSAAERAIDPEQQYDNPYITDQREQGSSQEAPQTEFKNTEEDGDYEFLLTDTNKLLVIPGNAFDEKNMQPGDQYNFEGYTIILGKEVTNANGEIEYQGTDEFTIKNSAGVILAYTQPEEPEVTTPTPRLPNGGAILENDNLAQYGNGRGYTDDGSAFNALVNNAGRIESFANIRINSDQLLNLGRNYNTGPDKAILERILLRRLADQNRGYQELWRDIVGEAKLNAEPGRILAGSNLAVNTRNIFNQSSTLAARGNLSISAETLTNQTYSELAKLSIVYQKRRKWKKYGKYRRSTDWLVKNYHDRVYSKEAGLILAGGTLAIGADNIFNDQVNDINGRFYFGRDQGPAKDQGNTRVNQDLLQAGQITLPSGSNGLFKKAAPASKYMVESNVSFMRPGWFLGSEYFMNIYDYEVGLNKIIGDPAYETRLLMDQIRKLTYGHYLTNNGQISSDYEQMKALYDGAAAEGNRLGLKVGVALSPEQIASLQSDIIWYVEQVVEGQKVLVPQLYLCPSTLADLAVGGSGAKMSGNTLLVEAGSISNSGDLFARDFAQIKTDTLLNASNWQQQASIMSKGGLRLEAGTLHNSSGFIGGRATQIKADNLLNETKVYTEETRLGENYNLTQKTGYSGVINGATGLQLEVGGTLLNRGAKLTSTEGNIQISAGNVIFDTVELHNRTESVKTKSGFLSKSKTLTVTDSRVNVGSSLEAAENVRLDVLGDASFRGSTIKAGKDALLNISGELNVAAAHDTFYTYSKKSKSSWGGLKKKINIQADESSRLSKSSVNVHDGLTIISGRDTNVIGSEINTGGNAGIYTGYKLGLSGLEESGEKGSFNLLNDYETTKHYEKQIKKNYTSMVTDIATGNWKAKYSNGKLSASVEGKGSKDTWDNQQKNVAGSQLNIGGNLQVGASENITVRGSDINVGGDIQLAAKNNLNILADKDTEFDQKTHEEDTLRLKGTVGNAYIDAALALKAMNDATKALSKAKSELKEMRRLRDEGRATDSAVADAELNLTLAIANEANAVISLANTMAGTASSSSTYGFYASGGIEVESKITETTVNSSRSVASNLQAGGNITLEAGNDLSQIGSHLVAKTGDINYQVANNLFLAADDSRESSRTRETTRTAGVSVGNNGVMLGNFSAGKNTSSSMAVDWSNSSAQAENGTIRFNVGNDLIADGFNALGKNIQAQVGGNFTLASKQNSSSSSGSSSGFNVGLGKGSLSGGFNKGSDSGERQWTDQLSSITGTESVEINVGQKLSLSGSLIANLDATGQDQGQLSIKAGALDWKDLRDYSENSSKNLGLSSSSGLSLGEQVPPSGTTTLTLKSTGSEKEGTTRATIGTGNLLVADGSGSGINRDTSRTQELFSDKITGALDSDLNLDNRLLTADGLASIAKDLAGLPENTLTTAKGAGRAAVYTGKTAYDVLDTLVDSLAGNTDRNFFSTVNDKITRVQVENQLALRHPEVMAVLNGERTATLDEMNRMAESVAEVCRENGLELDGLFFYGESGHLRLGFYDQDKKLVGLNLFGPQGGFAGAETLTQVLHHELGHVTGGQSETYAEYMGRYGSETRDLVNFLYNNDYKDSGLASEWAGSNLDSLSLANEKAARSKPDESMNFYFAYGFDIFANAEQQEQNVKIAQDIGKAQVDFIIGMGEAPVDAAIFLGQYGTGAVDVALSKLFDDYQIGNSGKNFIVTNDAIYTFGKMAVEDPRGTASLIWDKGTEYIVNADAREWGNILSPISIIGATKALKGVKVTGKSLGNLSFVTKNQTNKQVISKASNTDTFKLTNSQAKGVRSLEKRIAEHEDKLRAFIENPTVMPGMENMPIELIKKQQAGRIEKLRKEINGLNKTLEKTRRGAL